MPNFKFCCNPLKKKNHARILKNVSNITTATREKYREVIPNSAKYICKVCRSSLTAYKIPSREISDVASRECEISAIDDNVKNVESVEDWQQDVEDEMDVFSCDSISLASDHSSELTLEEVDIEELNGKVCEIVSLIKQAASHTSVQSSSTKKMLSSYKKQLIGAFEDDEHTNEMAEMIDNMKKGIAGTDEYSEKLKILRFAPKSWSVRKLVTTFNVSYSMAQKARQLNNGIGMMRTRKSRRRKPLDQSTLQAEELSFEEDQVFYVTDLVDANGD